MKCQNIIAAWIVVGGITMNNPNLTVAVVSIIFGLMGFLTLAGLLS